MDPQDGAAPGQGAHAGAPGGGGGGGGEAAEKVGAEQRWVVATFGVQTSRRQGTGGCCRVRKEEFKEREAAGQQVGCKAKG